MKETFWKDIFADGRLTGWFAFVILALTATQLGITWCMKGMVDACNPEGSFLRVFLYIGFAFFLAVLEPFLKRKKIYYVSSMLTGFEERCRNRIYAGLEQMPYVSLHEMRFGKYDTNIIHDVENLGELVFDKVCDECKDILFFLSAFVIMVYSAPSLALPICVFAVLFTAVIYAAKRTVLRYFKITAEKRDNMNDMLHEILSNQKVIAMYGMEEHYDERLRDADKSYLHSLLKSNIFGPSIQSSVEMATMFSYLIIFLRFDSSGASVGTLFMFLAYMPQVWAKYSVMMDIFNNVTQIRVYRDRLYGGYSDQRRGLERVGSEYKKQAGRERIACIEAEGISFSFPANEKKILDKRNFYLESPGIYFIHGPSGSGKSTLFDILLGFYRLEGGKIFINGEEEESLSGRRAEFALIPQQDCLFSGTIRENICMGREIAREKILEEMERLRCRDIWPECIGCLDMEIDGEGRELSLGKKKAVSMLRAACGEASVYLLDEITANLDDNTGQSILAMTNILGRDAICLFITHDQYDQHNQMKGWAYAPRGEIAF